MPTLATGAIYCAPVNLSMPFSGSKGFSHEEDAKGDDQRRDDRIGFVRRCEHLKALIIAPLSGDALRAKAMRGGAWLGGWSVAEMGVRFVRNMLLARLLAPDAFGTMAIILSSASLVDTLSDVGMRAAIIQNPRGEQDAYLNTSWWLGMGRAVLSYSVIFIVAPWISHFYGRAELTGLLRVALLSILFGGAISPRSVLAQRKMRLGRWAAITNGGAICGVILTVVLGTVYRNVWPLAIGYCSESAFRCTLSYSICPGLPSLGWDRQAARELLTFSRGVFGLAFLNLIINRADVFVLAKLYSSAALGLYTLAVTLVTAPSGFLTNILGQALLPALSSVQEDTERVNRILQEVTSWLMLLGLPTAVTISLCAKSLLTVFFGGRYVVASGPLSLASAVVFLNVVNALVTGVLFAKGLPALHRKAVVASAITMLITIYPASKFLGLVGGQVAGLLAIVVGYVFQLIRLRAVTAMNLFRYGRGLILPGLGSLIIVGIVLSARRISLSTKPPADIALSVAICVTVCAACALVHLRPLRGDGTF